MHSVMTSNAEVCTTLTALKASQMSYKQLCNDAIT